MRPAVRELPRRHKLVAGQDLGPSLSIGLEDSFKWPGTCAFERLVTGLERVLHWSNKRRFQFPK